MHPELFTVGNFTVHTYGFMIMIGAVLGFLYFAITVKKELGIEREPVQNLAILVIVSAVIGGKIFFYLEDPGYYFSSWDHLKHNFRTGFVVYGSLIFATPIVIWYFRKYQWPVWPLLDRVAISACLIHGTGRLGCFFAGCCHGVGTDVPWAVTFTNGASQAPLHTPLHPTQLYAVAMIYGILMILWMFRRHQRFEGQLFFIYIILYAIGRAIIEVFRGDEERGYIMEEVLSHSQFISLLVIGLMTWVYVRFKRKAAFKQND